MNSVTVVKLGFLVVLLGAVAAGATATSGWLVGEPAQSPSPEPTTTASGAEEAATSTGNGSAAVTTPTDVDARLLPAALVSSAGAHGVGPVDPRPTDPA